MVGVYGWQKKRAKDQDGKPQGERQLIDALASIPWQGRPVYICFDSDAATNPGVRRAEVHLAEVLARHGAIVKVVRLPAGDPGPDGTPAKVGLDDFLVDHGPDAFLDLLADLDRQRKALIEELEKAKAEAASQAGDNLGEFASLVKLLDDAEPAEREALRKKIRAALRRLVKEMWALIVPRGTARLIAVQVFFAEGGRRDYLICHQPAVKRFGRDEQERWSVRSFADMTGPDGLDLRRKGDVRQMEKFLASAKV